MLRWIILLLVAPLLGACATDYRGYERHSDYYERHYGSPTYVGGSTYYEPGYRDQGDYYYGQVSNYHYPLWIDNPYYYSVFWPLQRGFYDPFWNPSFYYGVTYFPRNYFSLSLYGGHYGHYGRFGGGWAYSPYRGSWVDHYYDWYPYYRIHSRHAHWNHPPRYGNARHEAERLARLDRNSWRGGHGGGSRLSDGVPRNRARDADYSSRGTPRIDPGVRGFDRSAATQRGELRQQRGLAGDRQQQRSRVDNRRDDARGAFDGSRQQREAGIRAEARSVDRQRQPRDASARTEARAASDQGRRARSDGWQPVERGAAYSRMEARQRSYPHDGQPRAALRMEARPQYDSEVSRATPRNERPQYRERPDTRGASWSNSPAPTVQERERQPVQRHGYVRQALDAPRASVDSGYQRSAPEYRVEQRQAAPIASPRSESVYRAPAVEPAAERPVYSAPAREARDYGGRGASYEDDGGRGGERRGRR